MSDREFILSETYEVSKVIDNYSSNGVTYPGKTFLIINKKWKTNDKARRMDIYFNEQLNWVVGNNLYKGGKITQNFILMKWE